MTPFKARAIIARHTIHDQLAYYGEDGDEQHYDIGDWRLIVDRVREAAPQPVMAIEHDQIVTDLCDQNVGEWPLADDRSPARAACILCDDRPGTYAWHTLDGPAHTWHWIQDVLPHMLACGPLRPGVQSVRVHGWEVAQLTAVNGQVIVRTIDGRLRHATESTWIDALLRIWGMA